MTHQDIKKQSAIIGQYLANKHLKDAFDALHELIDNNQLITYKTQLESLQTTYKYMLQYTVASANDPSRKQVYDKLFVDTYELSDNLEQQLLSAFSSQLPYATFNNIDNTSIEEATAALVNVRSQYDTAVEVEGAIPPYELTSEYQQSLVKLFNILWTSPFYKDEELALAQGMSLQNVLTPIEQCTLTSAISLSLWRNFDKNKFEALFNLAASQNDTVRQRAYVGIIIAVYIYTDRLSVFSSIQARFTLLAEDIRFTKAIEPIIIQFIRTKESEKIARRFSEEIIPEMIKLSPQMQEKLNFTKSNEDQEGDEDKNPDWKEIIDEVPGLTDKMKEISEMQMEGADVFLSTFSMLKSFPFFYQLHNWLMPFDASNPEIAKEANDKTNELLIESIADSRFLCNSDKYSFVMSMQQMPDEQKKQMSSAIGVDFEGMKEIQKDETTLNKDRKSEYISNQYIQDLYRLFNLHPRKDDFDNIFDFRLDFHNKDVLARLVENPKVWRNIAEYYFAKNYFSEAAELYDKILVNDSANIELLQKRGYCSQKQTQYTEALEYYLKADLVESNNSWTIKKIAYCYRALEQAEQALEYYHQAIQLQPKNFALQLSAGHCHLSLNQHEEALNTYFKIELESKSGKKAWRPIAWCSFISNKLEQATRYYDKVIADKATAHDYINAGHAYLAAQKNEQALGYYETAIKALDGDIDKFLSTFNDDKIHLLAYDVDNDILPILLDKLRYDLD